MSPVAQCYPDPEALGSRIAAVLREYEELAAAWLFGSAARGELTATSDVDVGLLFRERGAGAEQHHRLLGEIAARLEGVTAPYPVDLVVLETQGPIFGHNVLREGRRILETDRERRIDFESDTIVRAFDFRPTWELAAREQVGGMRRWLKRYLA
jgi:predicted nucleotidyltransferase